jgi:hypothetical protein
MALGMLAALRIDDHALAKRTARELTARLLDDFRVAHRSVHCRALLGIDLRAPGAHDEFLAGDLWRERCMGQVEFVVRALVPLADEEAWARAVRDFDPSTPAEGTLSRPGRPGRAGRGPGSRP